jgi:2-methylisocitrate lyase-like PEP mutase family enzyme
MWRDHPAGRVPAVSDPTMAERFRALHVPGTPLLMPNPWDSGSARLLAHLGFSALATTSAGFAATLGRFDGGVTREEALAHGAAIAAAVDVPVSADLENAFAADPAGVAETVAAAAATALAGCSVEDYTGNNDDPIYPLSLARERIAAAVQAAKADPGFVLTARAENFLRGRPDLADTIARLNAYEEAGADVVFAPGLSALPDVRAVVRSVGIPVSYMLLPGGPGVAELAEAGVARISVGVGFAWAATGAVARMARDLLDGKVTYWELAGEGSAANTAAFKKK